MRKNKIIVVGIFVVDLSFKSSKLPKPGETVIGGSYNIGPGGKGSNQCVAIARAGGDVSLIARIGDDQFGKMGLNLYESENVGIEGLVIAKDDKTGSAAISLDKFGMNSIIVVPGASSGLNKKMIDQKIDLFNSSSILSSIFCGIFKNHIDSVNNINSTQIAKQKGLEISTINHDRKCDYQNLITVTVYYEKKSRKISGTLIGGKIPRITEVQGIPIEANFFTNMLYVRNYDKKRCCI